MLECFEMESLGDICIAIVVEGVILCLLFWFWVKQTDKPFATFASANKKINWVGNSNSSY